jgi:putative membrane protein
MLLNKPIPFVYIFHKVKYELLYVLLIGLAVYFVKNAFGRAIPEIPLTIPTFLGTAISVILSFKLSQSYDRWWEARKIWGSIVNDSRNLVLQMQAFLKEGNENVIRRVALRHIAWCYCLGMTLRELKPTNGLDKYLSQDDLQSLGSHSNKPLALLQQTVRELAELKNNGQVDLYSHVQLNTTLVNLTNAMGMAERIKGTVFPVTYRIFLHMIIYLFIIMLSISLRALESHFEIPLLLIIAALFFLLERTATHMQDPFSNKPTDTAMTAIATNIEINLKQLIGEEAVPQPLKPKGFYLE